MGKQILKIDLHTTTNIRGKTSEIGINKNILKTLEEVIILTMKLKTSFEIEI